MFRTLLYYTSMEGLKKESIERYKEAVIVSGFPGIGKTTLFNNEEDLVLLDSDSTNFSWADEKKTVRHENWPQNYIEHLTGKRGEADAVFVSSHDVVREALVKAGIPFVLVYPSLNMKDEYIQRYKDRGSNEKFVQLLEQNYEKWIEELMKQEGCTHIVLQPGEYLSDVMARILKS